MSKTTPYQKITIETCDVCPAVSPGIHFGLIQHCIAEVREARVSGDMEDLQLQYEGRGEQDIFDAAVACFKCAEPVTFWFTEDGKGEDNEDVVELKVRGENNG